jgi:hypothetical protein
MPEHPRLRALLDWSLAAFHAGFLFAVLIALVYAGGGLGNLLSGLNTWLGLGLYAVFWATTWWTTRRAARGFAWSALDRPAALAGRLWRVALWGGLNGVLFFLIVLGLIVGNVLALVLVGRAQASEILSFVVFGGAIGAAVSFVAGVVVALLFALLDGALLALARWLAPAEAALDAPRAQ